MRIRLKFNSISKDLRSFKIIQYQYFDQSQSKLKKICWIRTFVS